MVVFDARTLRIYKYPAEVARLCEQHSLLEAMDICNNLSYLGKLKYDIIELDDFGKANEYNPQFTIFENSVKVNGLKQTCS